MNVLNSRRTAVLWSLLLCASLPSTFAASGPVLDICDLISDLRSYAKKTVSVRGHWVATEEGSWLVPIAESCRSRFVTGDWTWDDSIHLRPANPGKSVVNSAPDQRKLETYRNTPRARQDRIRLIVTLTGELVTKDNYGTRNPKTGRIVYLGFGHLSTSPAELVYKEIEDVELVDQARSSELQK